MLLTASQPLPMRLITTWINYALTDHWIVWVGTCGLQSCDWISNQLRVAIAILLCNSHQKYRWSERDECDSFFPYSYQHLLQSLFFSPAPHPHPPPASPPQLHLPLSYLSISFSLPKVIFLLFDRKNRQVMVHLFA